MDYIKCSRINTHKWIVKSFSLITDTILLIFLIWFGVTHNLFNFNGDWWYSLLTIYVFLFLGYIYNWTDKED